MAGPSIFISHSAKEPGALAFQQALVRALADAGFDVWADTERLTGSETWRADINRALQTCRGGVVLLSPAALTSSWVPYEAGVLAHRRGMTSVFPLLPVYLEGLAPEALNGNRIWGPIDLPSIQAVAADADGIVDKLRPLLSRHQLDSPQARLENTLAHQLQQAGRGALESAASRLRMSPMAMEGDLPRALAQRLLEVPIEHQYDALRLVADVAADAATKVYAMAAPHGWIPPASGDSLRSIAARPHGQRGAGINAEQAITRGMYVSHAFHEWRACEVEGGVSDRDVEELLERSRGALLEWLGHDPADPVPSDESIDAEIGAAEDNLPFLVLPLDAAFPAALAAVRHAWKHVPILVRCSEETEAAFDARGLPFMTILRPPVDPAEEARIIPIYQQHLRTFRRRAGAAT